MIYNSKILIFTLLFLIFSKNILAQWWLSTYIDAGENNVSEGFYTRSSVLGSYQFGKIKIEGGSQFDLKSAGSNFLTGSTFIVAREFLIKNFQFETQVLLMYNPFSNLVHELNRGILISIERKHFTYKLGTEFRKYHITDKAAKNYDIELNRSLHENRNLIYLLQYDLKPTAHKWNVGASITNIDHFLINQETNPMINIKGKYKITTPLTLYAESWYKSAGSLNISANYFGYFIRTGLIWYPELKK